MRNPIKSGLPEPKPHSISILRDGGTYESYKIKHPTWLLRFWWWITRNKKWKTTITVDEPIRNHDAPRPQ